MELVTDNIDEARSAFAALSIRTETAETTVAALKATVANLSSALPQLADENARLSNYTDLQVGTNANLVATQAAAVSPDLSLGDFVVSLGLAAAISEATMPDRTLTGLSATLQTYLSFSPQADGSKAIGLRLYQPELGTPTALATISFELAKVTTAPGTPAPRNLYTVLAGKQSLFANAFFAPYAPAAHVVAEATTTLSQVAGWTIELLLATASAIAGFETALLPLLVAAVPQAAGAYATAVKALSDEVAVLSSATGHAGGDVYALATALDATTVAARALLP